MTSTLSTATVCITSAAAGDITAGSCKKRSIDVSAIKGLEGQVNLDEIQVSRVDKKAEKLEEDDLNQVGNKAF